MTSPTRLNRTLYVLAVLLLCACALGGYLAWQERGERAEAKEQQERYGAVLAAADELTTAFINIDYRAVQDSLDAVAALSTGEFKEQYVAAGGPFEELMTREESVRTGEVVWSGVVSLDEDSARVIAATQGTVANRSTEGEPFAEYFRLLLDLELVDGEWLTSNVEFVG
jgi:Mce-associated membrane protein